MLEIAPLFDNKTDGSSNYDTVDIYDAQEGKWSTAQLSVARNGLASTSLPLQGLAMFAGGIGRFENDCSCVSRV